MAPEAPAGRADSAERLARRQTTEPLVVATAAEAARCATPPLIVLERLEPVLDAAGLGTGPVEAEPIGDGHSNFTFTIRRGAGRWVLRRPPRPPFPPSTHDVLREFRILSELSHEDVRTPRALAACDDVSVIGAPFYVMEHVDGEVFGAVLPARFAEHGERGGVGEELVDALVEIHAVDWRASGLAGLGRSEGYLARQLRRFGGLWETYRTRPVPAVDRVGRLLATSVPTTSEATLVHGDFRLGNAMFSSAPPARLLAVVDWEMATIGDPLADVGYMTAMWAEPSDRDGIMVALGAMTAHDGFSTREELAARYAARSGRSVEALGWYQALAHWKTAILLEGSYRRLLRGTTADPFFARLKQGVPELGQRALAALGER